MRRMQTIEKVIGENTFYIRPFGAFAAANISGELAALLSPILAGIAPLFGGLDTGDGGSDAAANPLDMDIEEAMPAISSALSTISGDKVERMMRRLLIDSRISAFRARTPTVTPSFSTRIWLTRCSAANCRICSSCATKLSS